jgi:hypothetical protein
LWLERRESTDDPVGQPGNKTDMHRGGQKVVNAPYVATRQPRTPGLLLATLRASGTATRTADRFGAIG